MAPKKKVYNGFSLFMSETLDNLAKRGIRMSMSEMPDFCKNDWEKMPDERKEIYKQKSKQMKNGSKIGKFTSIGEKVSDVQKQSDDIKAQTAAMYEYIKTCVNMEAIFLPKQKFILIHINPYTSEKEGYYFPAEITMGEFSLERGLIRIFHKLIGFNSTKARAPVACAADIISHAKNNHQIDIYSKLPDNYTEVFKDILSFINEKGFDEIAFDDPKYDPLPIYTAHASIGNELMITNTSLKNLYESSLIYDDVLDYDKLIKVYHLDKLFMELKNVSYDAREKDKNNKDEGKAIPTVAIATDFLNKDMFSTIKSIGCTFHEKLDYSHVCSNYYVCKWISILSTHCCQYYNIKITPGCHFGFDLSKIDVPIEEISESPNTFVDDSIFLNDPIKKKQDLTANSFPALKCGLTKVISPPLWNRPIETKVTVPNNILSSNADNFPRLDTFNKALAETPTLGLGNWSRNTGRGRGIIGQLQNNNAAQSSETSSKSWGRGLNIRGKK